jgi:uncharacterized protein
MRTKLINDGTRKSYMLALENGDEAVSSIEGFVLEKGIGFAELTGGGAFSDAVLEPGYSYRETKGYCKIIVREQVEVVCFLGEVALSQDSKPILHPHVVVRRADGVEIGGQLIEAHVRPTMAAVLTQSPQHLNKFKDGDRGLPTIADRE